MSLSATLLPCLSQYHGLADSRQQRGDLLYRQMSCCKTNLCLASREALTIVNVARVEWHTCLRRWSEVWSSQQLQSLSLNKLTSSATLCFCHRRVLGLCMVCNKGHVPLTTMHAYDKTVMRLGRPASMHPYATWVLFCIYLLRCFGQDTDLTMLCFTGLCNRSPSCLLL